MVVKKDALLMRANIKKKKLASKCWHYFFLESVPRHGQVESSPSFKMLRVRFPAHRVGSRHSRLQASVRHSSHQRRRFATKMGAVVFWSGNRDRNSGTGKIRFGHRNPAVPISRSHVCGFSSSGIWKNVAFLLLSGNPWNPFCFSPPYLVYVDTIAAV